MKTGKNKKKRILIEIIVVVVLLGLCVWTWVPFAEHITFDLSEGNNETTRVVLITDLHSCYYGPNQNTLIKMVEKQNPDIVILSGDIFDDKLKEKNAEITVKRLAEKYPCYYVTGNHEFWSEHVEVIKETVRNAGVTVLEGDCETIDIRGREIDICGVDDPTRLTRDEWTKQMKAAYSRCDESHIKILASHRPERVNDYEQFGFDLILAGHAHAGQFRIPIINRGLFAPNQGFFPEYINGAYKLKNGSTLVVSRGLARESTPLPRFFNHPEIVVIDIE